MAFEFKLPDIGEGVVEGEIIKWLISPGSVVAEDQPMVEVMTDKATVEIPSPVRGKVLKTIGAEGEVVEVGATMVVIETDEDGKPATPEVANRPAAPVVASGSPPAVSPSPSRSSRKALATPAVRKFAREQNVEISRVSGTGPGGRITREDIESYLRGPAATPTAPAQKRATRRPSPLQDVDSIPYRGLRKKIGDHLVASKRFAPHYTYVEEVDATQLVELRKRYQELNPKRRLTYLPFLMKAVVRGLKAYPIVNSTLDEDQQVILLKKRYNIGVAVATDQGLIVPVVKDVDRKGLLQISDEIAELSEQARQGKVKLEDLRDGTFTITSLGFLGGVMATPVINYPEVAILGVHKISPRPVVRDGQIVIREMMNLSASLDHRIVDGAVGARFMHAVIPYIENPGLLAVE